MRRKPGTVKSQRTAFGRGFCLIEVVVSLVVLSIMTSSVLVVMNRCMAAADGISRKAEAFEVVRENMERILISHSVEAHTDFGRSERYPGVEWQTTVETFSPPVGGDTWVRAVCTGRYQDAGGETQEVELVHWLTALTDSQVNALDAQSGGGGGELLRTLQEAADYAGVDPATIELWQERGLVTTAEGEFITTNLDLFLESGGQPSAEDLALQVDRLPVEEGQQGMDGQPETGPPGQGADARVEEFLGRAGRSVR